MDLKVIIVSIIIALLVAMGSFYSFQKDIGVDIEHEIAIEFLEKEEPKTFGGEIYEMIQNPAEKIPQTNPFKTKTNPFEGLKINPFE